MLIRVAVVTVATNRVIGSVRSDWREDLPLVATGRIDRHRAGRRRPIRAR